MANRRASLLQVGQHGGAACEIQLCAEKLIEKQGGPVSKGTVMASRRASLITLALREDGEFPPGCTVNAFKKLSLVHEEKEAFAPWRMWVRQKVLQNKWFDRTILTLIVLNCLFLAMADPTANQQSTRNQIVTITDYVFIICFSAEMIAKVIGLGLYAHSFSYLRDPWCVLDGFIVIVGWTSIILSFALGASNEGLGALRPFRLLRPLRAVNHIKEVRLIVSCLLQSLPRLADVLLLFLFFLLLMSITAIMMWKGLLRSRCVQVNPDAAPMYPNDVGRVCARLNNPGMSGFQCPWGWECQKLENPFYGKVAFDNIWVAVLTLFTGVTTEGWTDTMYAVMDGATHWCAVYFVFLILVGSFFISNLALVMLSIAFFEAKAKEDEMLSQQIEPLQIEVAQPEVIVKRNSIAEANDNLRSKVRNMIRTKAFEYSITGVIVCNTLSMATEHHGQSSEMTVVLENLNYIFTGIFGCETILKLYGLGFRVFAEERANIFDALVVVLSLVDIIQNQISNKKTGISVLRSLRLARIFKQFPGLWATTLTILRSLESVSVLILLLLMVIFIYGLLGMQLFGGKFCGLAADSDYIYSSSDYCVKLPRSHFDNLGVATTTVFQVITSENWNNVMFNGMRSGGNRASNLYSLYFVSLIIIGDYIVLNLFIAVLINNFSSSAEDASEPSSPPTSPTPYQKLKASFTCCCPHRTARVAPSSQPPSPSATSASSIMPEEVKNFLQALDSCETPTVANAAAKKALNTTMGNALYPQLIKAGWSDQEGEFQFYNGTVARELSEVLRDNLSSDCSDVEALTYLLGKIGLPDEEGNPPINHITGKVLESNPDLLPILSRYGWREQKGFGVDLSRQMAESLKMELEAHTAVRNFTRKEHPAFSMTHIILHDTQMQTKHVEDEENDRALFILPATHPIRVVLYKIVTHKYFEAFIILLIVISTVSLTMADPLAAPDELIPRVTNIIDLTLTICFSIEAMMKIIAHGFVLHQSSYLRRDPWNVLDFIIVVFSVISQAFSNSSGAQQLEIFRMMRTLRPLRFINKSPGLKLVVVALMSSIPPMANIAFITTLVFFIFGIMGVQFFKGTFYACTQSTWGDISYPLWTDTDAVKNAPMTKTDCLATGNRWVTYMNNFDHLGAALLALFEVATTEGWMDIMHKGQDAVGINHAPVKMSQPYMALYFIIFLVIGGFFVINLFVGVLIEQYNTAKDRNEEQQWLNLSESQRQWLAVQDIILLNTPKMNKQEDMSAWRMHLFQFVQHSHFDGFILAAISINTVMMATEHVDQSEKWDSALQLGDLIFLCIFVIEAVVKITVHRAGYFQDAGNRFDFTVVFISGIGNILQALIKQTMVHSGLRVLRLARLIRVMRSASGVRALLKTLLRTLGNLVNVAGLLFLLFFLYAVLGVTLFGRVQRGDCLSDNANFDQFFNAILLLFRMTTGEAWECIMNDCRVLPPDCDDQLGNCGIPLAAVIYFPSFMVFGMYILLNVFIAIILSGYEIVSMEENALLTEDHVNLFYSEWEKRDPKGTRLMPIREIASHLRSIGAPLGYDSTGDDQCDAFFRKTLLHNIGHKCHNYNGHVSYRELLRVLIDFNLFKYGLTVVDDGYWKVMLDDVDKRWRELQGDDYEEDLAAMEDGYASVELSAMMIQKVWRGKRGRALADERRKTVVKNRKGSISSLSVATTSGTKSEMKSSQNTVSRGSCKHDDCDDNTSCNTPVTALKGSINDNAEVQESLLESPTQSEHSAT